MTLDDIERILKPFKARLALLVGRGVLRRVDDASKVQEVQAEMHVGEICDRIERHQNYGFTSHPLPGLPVVVIFQGGERDNGMAVAVGDHLHRPKNLPEGDVALYTDQDDGEASAEDAAHRAQLTREKKFVIRCDTLDVRCGASTLVFDADGLTIVTPMVTVTAADKVKLDTPLLEVTGKIEAAGDIKDLSAGAGRTMSAMRGAYNGHVHPPGAAPPAPAM